MDVKVGDVSGKTFVVTGANTGLGYESMKAIMLGGGHVIMGCRSEERAAAALERVKKETEGKGSVEFVKLDLADLESVKEFAENVKAKHSELYCLMNNAGIMFCDKMKTKQGFEMQMGTNHFGHFALTMHLLPLLKASKEDPRIVNVTSLGAHPLVSGGAIDFDDIHCDKHYNRYTAYGRSKFANLVFHYELVRRLEGTNIIAIAAHPGYTKTELARHSWITRINHYTPLSLDAATGALSQIHAATSHDIKSGEYYGPRLWFIGYPAYATAPEATKDPEVGSKFWKVSEELTGVKCPLGQ
eukprot:TRINITY_DN791_c0_g1_i1.p1 TRINITY_DN791_c0_g1~~TRINITY_DN791_c0_g1_i1.p1  ORF type:complete len:313 (+),score=114.06 TRINITY_DN791_c0_g1_i1:42-941(+)